MPYASLKARRRHNTEWRRRWRRSHPEVARRITREYLRQWRPKNRSKVRQHNKRTKLYRKQWRRANPDRVLKYQRKMSVDVKRYLGGKCWCCGTRIKEFLTVDHIKNDGWKERKLMPNGRYGKNYSYYRTIVLAFRSGTKRTIARIRKRYRLACFNCNAARAYYGQCPHQRKK